MNISQHDLTEEDLVTMKQCRQLSFWRGSVPFTAFSVGVVAAANTLGAFSSKRYLLFPSYTFAVITGYLVGKVSYLSTCKRMFLELKDSRIKDEILRYEQGQFPTIVNTPVEQHPNEASPKSREEHWNFDQQPDKFSDDNTPSSFDSGTTERKKPPSFLYDDRPSGSFHFDDVYRPRD